MHKFTGGNFVEIIYLSKINIPVFPFWKKVPENILGRPENSFFEKASLIKGHELRTTTGLDPTNILKISPYFLDNLLKLLPKFLTCKKGMYPTNGRLGGPKFKFIVILSHQVPLSITNCCHISDRFVK